MKDLGREKVARSTQNIILDATEDLLRKEGYAAVTSRKVAQRTGMKSRVVHYHFGSMDELFLALIRRFEMRQISQCEDMLQSDEPWDRLWLRMLNSIDSVLLSEMSALAVHRTALREAARKTLQITRKYDSQLMEKMIREKAIAQPGLSPAVMAMLMSGLIRALAAERSVGMTDGHAETLDFIAKLLDS